MSIADVSTELIGKDGIYYSKTKTPVSFPEEGNDDCYEIEENSFWFNHRNNCITSAVKKYSPDALLFDIGGGNGYVAKGLESAGIPTVLVEPGIQGCIHAKKRGLSNIICSTLQDAQFKSNSMKAVGLFDVVEHIEDDMVFLRNVFTYLQPDGFVYITVPAYQLLWSDEDAETGHFRRYTLEGLSGKMKEAGFTIAYASYIFSVLPLPILLFRSLPSRLGIRRNSASLTKHKNEHKVRKGITDLLLTKIWKAELNAIQQSRKIAFGGSCFLIGKKSG